MTIIKARLQHLEKIIPLFDAYRQFYKQPTDSMGARKFLRERLENQESVIFLAMRGNDAIGFIQLYPSFSSVSMKHLWILNDLFVMPEARRQRVAEVLMAQARQFAIATEAKGLVLETAIDNAAAQALYEKSGWEKETEYERYILIV